jgi:ribosomal protein S18 acetylase RimI-like enzyme
MSAAPVELVRRLEECAARAWPAAHVSELDGWLLRHDHGVTRRANSVLPNRAAGRLILAEKVSRVEKLYAQWGLPPRYQMSAAAEPADLDGVLAARGYARTAPTLVQTAPLADVRARTAVGRAGPATVADRPDDPWLETFCRADGYRGLDAAARAGILRRVCQPAGYALLHLDGVPAAVGLGILDQEWVGVFCMATCAEHRRRGAATAVLHALAGWGQRHGATGAYLQVMEDNAGARSLYARVGFTTLYPYHYRQAPGDP